MSPDLKNNIDLGSMLLERSLVSANQLHEAFEQQKLRGGYLSQHLIELGHIQDNDLTSCLTCQYGFSYLPLRSYEIERSALEKIPPHFATNYCVIPIEFSDRLLTVAMADPLNKGVIEVLRQISRCEILVFVSTRHEIKEAIEKYYGVPFKNFDLDKYQNDDILRDNLKCDKIVNGLYAGPNRRRYRRLQTELTGEYYSYPNIVRTKIVNLSMSGILFEARTPQSPGTQLAINLHLDKNKFITTVVEVIRCATNNVVDSIYQMDNPLYHETAAFINFLSEENQEMLAEFLRGRLCA